MLSQRSRFELYWLICAVILVRWAFRPYANYGRRPRPVLNIWLAVALVAPLLVVLGLIVLLVRGIERVRTGNRRRIDGAH